MSIGRVKIEQVIWKDAPDNGRDLVWHTILANVWRGWGKSQKTPGGTAGFQAQTGLWYISTLTAMFGKISISKHSSKRDASVSQK
jgi:hypothetical protein